MRKGTVEACRCPGFRPLPPEATHGICPVSEKADLVWSAQVLSVTKALVFGFVPEIPATNTGRRTGARSFVRVVSNARNAPVELFDAGANHVFFPTDPS